VVAKIVSILTETNKSSFGSFNFSYTFLQSVSYIWTNLTWLYLLIVVCFYALAKFFIPPQQLPKKPSQIFYSTPAAA